MSEYFNFFDKISKQYFNNKSVLLIGSGGTVDDYSIIPDIFIKNGAKSCKYLEIWQDYIDALNLLYNRKLPYKIKKGDVNDITFNFTENNFDIIVWSNGPEHVTFEDFEIIINDLYYVAKDLVLLAVPYGNYWDNQEVKRNNPHEIHIQKNIQENTFDKFNFNKEIIGEKDKDTGQIFLWKELCLQ